MLLTNWVVWAKLGDGSTPPPRREDWSRHGRLEEALPHLEHWQFEGWVDVPALVRQTPHSTSTPCATAIRSSDGEGRVTLLGDAAHPMYPVGSNGAAQAILDGRVLARALAGTSDWSRPCVPMRRSASATTSPIVLSNRQMGPER